eukprot:COSAG02_NODE_10121_length_2017_cov_1.420751_3_plen_70_part_00
MAQSSQWIVPRRITVAVDVAANPVKTWHHGGVQISNEIWIWAPGRHAIGGHNTEPSLTKHFLSDLVQLQ